MKIRPDTWVTLGVVGVGGYLLYQLLSKAKDQFTGAYDSARDAVASGLYALFGPALDPMAAETTFYTVRFPDGQSHTVPRFMVDANGRFFGPQKNLSIPAGNWQLLIDRSGRKYAALA